MRRLFLLCFLALGLLTRSASAQAPVSFPAAQNGQISFVLPSQNIGCTFTPKGGTTVYQPFDGGPELSCDRVARQYVRLVLTPQNLHRFDNVGDRDCCTADNVLAYGARWLHPPFTCDSAATGLTCRREDGRGFSMSRSGITLQ